MNIKIKQKILLQAMDIHRHLVKEIKIEFSENGIRIFSVDPANYEMVITNIPKTACEEYDVDSKLEIGIDLQKIKDYLRLFRKDDVLAFGYDADVNRLLGREDNLTRGMGLFDLAGWPDPKIPKVDLKNRAIVDSKTFYSSLKGVMVNKNYEQTYITIIHDSLILENQDGDEDEDKKHKSEIVQGIQDIEINYSDPGDNNYTIFRSDILIKQINEYKKCFDKITIETSPEEPIRITANNDNLQVEYWLAPVIKETDDDQPVEDQEKEPDTEKELKPEPDVKEKEEMLEKDIKQFEEDRHENPPEQKDDWREVKEELENEQIAKDIKPVIDAYSDRLSIRKPKGLSYEKHQWTIDMEKIKDMLEKSLKKENKKALSKVTDVQGFVFFVVNPTDHVKVDDSTGENIIENLLPDGFVLIAWYRYQPDKWIAQTVEKVK